MGNTPGLSSLAQLTFTLNIVQHCDYSVSEKLDYQQKFSVYETLNTVYREIFVLIKVRAQHVCTKFKHVKNYLVE